MVSSTRVPVHIVGWYYWWVWMKPGKCASPILSPRELTRLRLPRMHRCEAVRAENGAPPRSGLKRDGSVRTTAGAPGLARVGWLIADVITKRSEVHPPTAHVAYLFCVCHQQRRRESQRLPRTQPPYSGILLLFRSFLHRRLIHIITHQLEFKVEVWNCTYLQGGGGDRGSGSESWTLCSTPLAFLTAHLHSLANCRIPKMALIHTRASPPPPQVASSNNDYSQTDLHSTLAYPSLSGFISCCRWPRMLWLSAALRYSCSLQ